MAGDHVYSDNISYNYSDILGQACANANIQYEDCDFFSNECSTPCTAEEMARLGVTITVIDSEPQLQQQQQQQQQLQPNYQQPSQVHQEQYQEQCQMNFSTAHCKGNQIQQAEQQKLQQNYSSFLEPIQSNIVIEVLSPEQNATQKSQQNMGFTNSQCNQINTPRVNIVASSNAAQQHNIHNNKIAPSIYVPVYAHIPQTLPNSVVLYNNMIRNSGSPPMINTVLIGGQLLTTSNMEQLTNNSPVFDKTVISSPTNKIPKISIQQLSKSTKTVKTSLLKNANNKQTPDFKCQDQPIKAGFTTPNNQMIIQKLPLPVRTTPVVSKKQISVLKPIIAANNAPNDLNYQNSLKAATMKETENKKLNTIKRKVIPLIVADEEEATIVGNIEQGRVANPQNQSQPIQVILLKQKDQKCGYVKFINNNNNNNNNNVNTSNTLAKKAEQQEKHQRQQQQQLLDEKLLKITRTGLVCRPPQHIIEDYGHFNECDITKSAIDCNSNQIGVTLEDPAKKRGKKRVMKANLFKKETKRQCTMLRGSKNALAKSEASQIDEHLKEFGESLRHKVSPMLTLANNTERNEKNVVSINDEVLCELLGLNSGFYKIKESFFPISEVDSSKELIQALPKMETENVKLKTVEKAFIKLEPKQDENFFKLDNGFIRSFEQDNRELGRRQNMFQCVSNGTTGGFNKTNGFKKLEPEILTQFTLQTHYGDNITNY